MAISTGGTLTISDVDSAQTFVAQASTAGSYGTFGIGTNGIWTYTASSAHDEFRAGQTYTDTFAVAGADGTTTSVTINIAGTNDLPKLDLDGTDGDYTLDSSKAAGLSATYTSGGAPIGPGMGTVADPENALVSLDCSV